jgi:hypothetical protein
MDNIEERQFSLFNLPLFHIVHIFSLFNLPFFHIFHIISHFNLLFFHISNTISHFKIWKKPKLNSENIWKIQKKIVKKYKKYRRKVGWNDIENMEEKSVPLYCPYLITIRLAFLPYFPYHFTIFFCIFKKFLLFNFGFFNMFHYSTMENTEEKKVK